MGSIFIIEGNILNPRKVTEIQGNPLRVKNCDICKKDKQDITCFQKNELYNFVCTDCDKEYFEVKAIVKSKKTKVKASHKQDSSLKRSFKSSIIDSCTTITNAIDDPLISGFLIVVFGYPSFLLFCGCFRGL